MQPTVTEGGTCRPCRLGEPGRTGYTEVMDTSTPESAADGIEDLEPAQMKEDLQRDPDEKRNREQAATSEETAVNERGEERPRADTVPPA